MVSKSQIKLIKSLSQKKYRLKNKLFVVEGKKGVEELFRSGLKADLIFATEDSFEVDPLKLTLISEQELKKISFLKTPQKILGVFRIPDEKEPGFEGLTVALDGVRDPGNLGTIIRLCDWFGVSQIICSPDTVDCYNPKVVQATMGSIARVKLLYTGLIPYFEKCRERNLTVYGTFMSSSNVYQQELPKKAVLVMGNEANGISSEIEKLVDKKIAIPQFGAQQQTESLNVAMATAILLSEFKRA